MWKNWKIWKNGQAFSSHGKRQGILQRLEKSMNLPKLLEKKNTEKLKKYWKSRGNLLASNSENTANMAPYFK